MNQAEFESIPITDKLMFDSCRVLDDNGEWWWVGFTDGKLKRRMAGPQFSSAEFVVRRGNESAKVRIPFAGEYSERVVTAATEWGAKNFNCAVDEIDSVQLVSP